MDTRTLSFWLSRLISLIVAGRVANGPSVTVIDSPTSKSTAFCATTTFCFGGAIIFTTSSMDSGEGREVWPTKPVTPGVLRTTDHDSSVRSMRTNR